MKVISKYFKKRKEAINRLLKRPRRSYTSETFHDLRVEIKKLDALLDLINFNSKNFNRTEIYKPFKLIFDQAGKVRELFIEESTIKKLFLFPLLKRYRKHLKELRSKEQEDYFDLADKKLFSELKKMYNKIGSLLAQLNKKEVLHYMDNRRNEIKKLLELDSVKLKEAHELRQLLKRFNYNRASFKLEKKYKPLPKESILPDLLGKWHDNQVILKQLKKAIERDGIGPKEANQFGKINAKISSREERLFKKINRAIAAS